MEKAPTVCEHKHYLQYVLYIITCVLSCRQQLLSGSAQWFCSMVLLLSDEQDDVRKLRMFH